MISSDEINASIAFNVLLTFLILLMLTPTISNRIRGMAPPPPVKGAAGAAGAAGGRIVARITVHPHIHTHTHTDTNTTRPSFFGLNTTTAPHSHGAMASFRGKKKLLCFYCNKRSGIVYDGLITQWECAKCDAMNYLDQDGEITDPPVATEYAAPSNRTYAIAQPDYQPSSQGSDTAIFCSTCQKNQHLYRTSLQQFDVECDPYHPEYRASEKAYYKYKRDLEKRYPQVCEDCAPKALERMKVAKKTAQADWLGRRLQDSRTKKFKTGFKSVSLLDLLKLAWFAGVLGQLLWNAVALIAASLLNAEANSDLNIPHFLLTLLGPLTSLAKSNTLAWRTLQLSFVSFVWNPKIKEAIAGGARLHTQIKGYRHWYKLQLVMIVTRSLTYYFMGKGILTDPFGPAAIGAHLVSFVFNALLAIKSQGTFKVDHSPLWTTVEAFNIVGPGSGSDSPTTKGGNSMEDILNEISTKPISESRHSSPSSTPWWDHSPPAKNYNNQPLDPAPLRNRNQVPTDGPRPQMDTMPGASARYLATGNIPDRQQYHDDRDEMDWVPIVPQKQHRAFNTPRALQGSNNTQLFGQTPVTEKSPTFWAKIPPAPITPAHRLRNPPNQPQLRVSSQEVKENFFNKVTRKNSNPDQTPTIRAGKSRQEIEFQQQRFFAPTIPFEGADSLADTFKGFSLGSSEETPRQKAGRRIRIGSLVSLFLAIGLVYTGMVYVKRNGFLSKGWAL